MEMASFDSEQAIGFGYAYRMTEHVALNLGGSLPTDGGDGAVRGGIAIEW
jgi:hypothetical protein